MYKQSPKVRNESSSTSWRQRPTPPSSPHNILFFKLRPCLSLGEPQFGGHGRDRSIKFFVFIASSSQFQYLYYMFPQTNKKYQKQKYFSIGIFLVQGLMMKYNYWREKKNIENLQPRLSKNSQTTCEISWNIRQDFWHVSHLSPQLIIMSGIHIVIVQVHTRNLGLHLFFCQNFGIHIVSFKSSRGLLSSTQFRK